MNRNLDDYRPDPIRVVVADPDDITRRRYRDALSAIGCDVLDAADGRDALAKALTRRPTIVVMETRLAYLDGVALCQVLRRDTLTRTVPILIITAEQKVSALNRAREAGADIVLRKPVAPARLIKEIQRLLKRQSEHSGRTSTSRVSGLSG